VPPLPRPLSLSCSCHRPILLPHTPPFKRGTQRITSSLKKALFIWILSADGVECKGNNDFQFALNQLLRLLHVLTCLSQFQRKISLSEKQRKVPHFCRFFLSMWASVGSVSKLKSNIRTVPNLNPSTSSFTRAILCVLLLGSPGNLAPKAQTNCDGSSAIISVS